MGKVRIPYILVLVCISVGIVTGFLLRPETIEIQATPTLTFSSEGTDWERVNSEEAKLIYYVEGIPKWRFTSERKRWEPVGPPVLSIGGDFSLLYDERLPAKDNWYNFKTKEFELRKTRTILDFSNYIPQNLAAQGLYKIHVIQGKTPIQAAIEVLRLSVKNDLE